MTCTQRLAAIALLLVCAAALPTLACSQTTTASGADASSVAQAPNVAPASPSHGAPIPLVPKKATWDTFQGQLNAQKYSPLTQINADNVAKLQRVWAFHTGDMSDGSGRLPASDWSATPIFANDTLYIGTPFYRIIALNPGTGKVEWAFNTHSTLEALTQPQLKSRGVAYWAAKHPVAGKACQKIIYIGTMDGRVFAVDADTGKPCKQFGRGGILDINQWNTTNAKWPLSVLQPPTVVGDHLIIGWSGKDWVLEKAPPGQVFSVDPQTGTLQWTFHTLPKGFRKQSGTANVWTAMSADRNLGLVYLPVSSPSPNYWGGNRTRKLPYATSTTALDVNTGKVVWSRQWVHHDLWDYDINSAPTLMNITVNGKKIPALIQATKMGFLFVVNRKTGEDVWPIVERPVPQGDGTVMGEQYSPTQPFPTLPKPLLDQKQKPKVSQLANIVSVGGCASLWNKLQYHGMYTPPSTNGEGVMAFPDSAGGVQWGGVAYDPVTETAVVNVSHIVQYIKLYPRDAYKKAKAASSDPGAFFAQKGAPYGLRLETALNWLGMPCWQPPYGELVAIDMHTGKVIWRRPVGASQKYGFFMPKSWGSPTIGGPAVTAGGLIFIGSTMDAKVHAYSLKTGKELWSDQTMAPVVANPAVYEYKGREYVAVVSGGNQIVKKQVGDAVVVYALPKKE